MPATQIRAGDIVLLDDGTTAAVTDVRAGEFWMRAGCASGVAIGWRSGTASGVLFREPAEALAGAV